jgi:hypothetical protein
MGIPIFAFILITRERNNLKDIQVREKFGFLYRGYRLKYYYWEIIIMFRKISLLIVSVLI